jgi:hypothetical protein
MTLAELGAQLRAAGLTARALDAWATTRLAALPVWLAARPERTIAPAAALLELLVAGAELPRARLRGPIDALIAHGLARDDGDRVRAELAILPHGAGFLVCDRLDAPVARDRVSWPDDSSYHLAAAIPPGRRPRWLDLACGSAFAPLARPQLADARAAADVNPRAVRAAELGAELSGVALTAGVADIAAPQAAADLVTCNAPIPDDAPTSPELWRRAEPGFFDRLWPALAAACRPGGLIVVHATLAALRAGLADAAGERAIVRYTPDHLPGFGVAWWRPDGPARLVEAARALTADRPHLGPEDRDAALC